MSENADWLDPPAVGAHAVGSSLQRGEGPRFRWSLDRDVLPSAVLRHHLAPSFEKQVQSDSKTDLVAVDQPLAGNALAVDKGPILGVQVDDFNH
jgi:hypothetical protein